MIAPTSESLPLPRWAARLGYTGLLPFVALAVAAWSAPAAYRAQATFALLAYGATIASFLGAIHWGLAMRSPLNPQPGPFVWGVFPSLVAWVALLLPVSQGLVTVALVLGMCLAVDRRSYPAYGLEEWLAMRLRLTLVATICLLAGSFTVWHIQ
jgi:fumarate reductase subunit D